MSPRQWLEKLVAFDTTTRNSNLELIEFIQHWLSQQNIPSWLAYNPEHSKANLFATIADQHANTQGGVVLSGHTDVVPVDGQNWHTPPFELTERDGKLYGRGSADMKGFIAVALALVPEWLQNRPKRPIHLAFSFDEEVGCVGVSFMLDELQKRGIQPDGCVVGEPTSMQVIIAHKGINLYRCCVHGKAAHSSLTPQGCNAIEHAARLICHIRDMADRMKAQGPYDHLYDVPFTTLTTNQIQGGIASNILPEQCEFVYEFRNLPGMSPANIQSHIEDYVRSDLLPRMQTEYAQARVDITSTAQAPALEADEQAAITQLVRALTGDSQQRKVAFATEAGHFQHIGIPTVVCGPGSIEQAHKPDEFIEISQMQACEQFLRKLALAL